MQRRAIKHRSLRNLRFFSPRSELPRCFRIQPWVSVRTFGSTGRDCGRGSLGPGAVCAHLWLCEETQIFWFLDPPKSTERSWSVLSCDIKEYDTREVCLPSSLDCSTAWLQLNHGSVSKGRNRKEEI